jgi:hypothetical protein
VCIPDLQPAGGPFVPAAAEQVTFTAHGALTLPWLVFHHFLKALEASSDIVDTTTATIDPQAKNDMIT